MSPQRTSMAWQRTALAVATASALVTRLAIETLGTVALVGVGLGLPLCGWVWLVSRRPCRHDDGMGSRAGVFGALAAAMLVLAILSAAHVANGLEG